MPEKPKDGPERTTRKAQTPPTKKKQYVHCFSSYTFTFVTVFVNIRKNKMFCSFSFPIFVCLQKQIAHQIQSAKYFAHTQIYTILHNVATYFLSLLFQVGIFGRFCALNASKIRAAFRRPSLRSVRRHSATLSKVAFYIQTLFSGKPRFYVVCSRGMGGGRVPFDSVSAYFFALRICTHIFFYGNLRPPDRARGDLFAWRFVRPTSGASPGILDKVLTVVP